MQLAAAPPSVGEEGSRPDPTVDGAEIRTFGELRDWAGDGARPWFRVATHMVRACDRSRRRVEPIAIANCPADSFVGRLREGDRTVARRA
jgi:hypothetical protein